MTDIKPISGALACKKTGVAQGGLAKTSKEAGPQAENSSRLLKYKEAGL